jgi:TPR repeat protein
MVGPADYNMALGLGRGDAVRSALVAGGIPAENNLGAMYAYGLGVPQDDELAKWWDLRASAREFAPAQYKLANMYLSGRGAKFTTAPHAQTG